MLLVECSNFKPCLTVFILLLLLLFFFLHCRNAYSALLDSYKFVVVVGGTTLSLKCVLGRTLYLIMHPRPSGRHIGIDS